MTDPPPFFIAQIIGGRRPGEHRGDRIRFRVLKDGAGRPVELTGTVIGDNGLRRDRIIYVMGDRRSNKHRSRQWVITQDNVLGFCEDMKFPEEEQ